jgi:hypothetical protein
VVYSISCGSEVCPPILEVQSGDDEFKVATALGPKVEIEFQELDPFRGKEAVVIKRYTVSSKLSDITVTLAKGKVIGIAVESRIEKRIIAKQVELMVADDSLKEQEARQIAKQAVLTESNQN